MRRARNVVALLVVMLALDGCSLRNLFGGGGNTQTAKQSAAQALVSTTNIAVALMTAAGLAYDAGAWGPPGSPQAEQMWSRVSAESLRLNSALTAWSKAILENKDSTVYAFSVEQAIAVLSALMPPRKTTELLPAFAPGSVRELIARLADPASFRAWSPLYAQLGGAR